MSGAKIINQDGKHFCLYLLLLMLYFDVHKQKLQCILTTKSTSHLFNVYNFKRGCCSVSSIKKIPVENFELSYWSRPNPQFEFLNRNSRLRTQCARQNGPVDLMVQSWLARPATNLEIQPKFVSTVQCTCACTCMYTTVHTWTDILLFQVGRYGYCDYDHTACQETAMLFVWPIVESSPYYDRSAWAIVLFKLIGS